MNGSILGASAYNKLQFLCDNKLGQISSPNLGFYLAENYPTLKAFDNEWRKIQISLGVDVPPLDDDEDDFIIDVENDVITPENEDDTDLSNDDESDTGASEVPRNEQVTEVSGDTGGEDGVSSLVSVLIAALVVVFLVPWIIIATI